MMTEVIKPLFNFTINLTKYSRDFASVICEEKTESNNRVLFIYLFIYFCLMAYQLS